MSDAPRAPKRPHETRIHGRTLLDDYFWLREKTSPDVLAHLESENAYTEAVIFGRGDVRESFDQAAEKVKTLAAGS